MQLRQPERLTDMDKLKIKLAVTAIERATDEMEKAIASCDHRQIGAQLYRLRQEIFNMRREIDQDKRDSIGAGISRQQN
jgi:hypothetical protein